MTEVPAAPDEGLFAALAHELKNPLNLIQLQVELLIRQLDPEAHPAVGRAAESIRKSVQKQAQLIDELTALAHARSSPPAPRGQPVELGSALRQIAESLEPAAAARQVDFQAELPQAPVLIDERWLPLVQTLPLLARQVLKAMKSGDGLRLVLAEDGEAMRLQLQGTDGANIALSWPPARGA